MNRKIGEDVTPREAYDIIMNGNSDEGFSILDVRTRREFTREKIEGAINIDFRSETFKGDIGRRDKSDKYLIYCRSGGRSKKARKLMKELGFCEVYNLHGGITQWMKEGFPTTV